MINNRADTNISYIAEVNIHKLSQTLCAKNSQCQRPSSSRHWKPLAPASVFLVEAIHTGAIRTRFPRSPPVDRGCVREKRRIADGTAMRSMEPTRAIASQPVVSDQPNSEGRSQASGKSRAGEASGRGEEMWICCDMETDMCTVRGNVQDQERERERETYRGEKRGKGRASASWAAS